MLQVEHLTKRYGAVTAVDDLSFEIAGAGVYGFLGPNGAGKSTTMNIMTGCLSATAGTVKISGYDIYESPREAKRRVGCLPEQPPLYLGETPAEFLRFVGEAKGLRGAELRRQIDAVVEETGIGDMRQRRISALSKGYRQRVGIAQALLGEPDTVILDEPTVGLDPIQILEIRALIAALGESRVAEAQLLHLRALPAQHGVDAGQELARLTTRSSRPERAVSMSIGVPTRFALSRRASSKPSKPGSITSSTMRSQTPLSAYSSPEGPS